MSRLNIHTYEELTLRISQLNNLKQEQETELKKNAGELYESLRLKNIVKKTIKDLANDSEFKEDGFKAATNFIIGKIFNKNNSAKGAIMTFIMEKVVAPLIKNNKEKIISFITELFTKYKKKEESQ
jgi:hypothetical protein